MKALTSIEDINCFIKENEFVMLYFSSSNCGVCVSLLPKIEALLKLYPKVICSKIEIESIPLAVGAFSIFTLPCILAFIDGKEIIREARFISIKNLEEKIERYYDFL